MHIRPTEFLEENATEIMICMNKKFLEELIIIY